MLVFTDIYPFTFLTDYSESVLTYSGEWLQPIRQDVFWSVCGRRRSERSDRLLLTAVRRLIKLNCHSAEVENSVFVH